MPFAACHPYLHMHMAAVWRPTSSYMATTVHLTLTELAMLKARLDYHTYKCRDGEAGSTE